VAIGVIITHLATVDDPDCGQTCGAYAIVKKIITLFVRNRVVLVETSGAVAR